MPRRLITVLRDPERKRLARMALEVAHCGLLAREVPVHYFTRFLYRQGAPSYRNFLGNRQQRTIQRHAHDSNIVPFFENKLLFAVHFEGTSVRTPPTLGYSLGETVRVGSGEVRAIDDVDAFRETVGQMMEFGACESIFLKPIRGIQGRGAVRIDRAALRLPVLHDVHSRILSGSFLFQPTLRQHRTIDAIHAGCVNTMRMDTIRHDATGEYELLTATFRFGGGRGHVDNVSNGGCFVPVDLRTGVLKDRGFTMIEHGGAVFESHPVTGTRFSGIQVPFFEEAKRMVLDAARSLPTAIAGWDVAVSEDGPVLIEANHDYAIRMSEITYGGYRRHPAFAGLLTRLAR